VARNVQLDTSVGNTTERGEKMKEKMVKDDKLNMSESSMDERLSPLDLIKKRGGKAHKVGEKAGRDADAMLAVYKGRFTYTFVMKKEVASIHFDMNSRKIYFSGHNIQNMKLTVDHKSNLLNLIKVLEADAEGRELKEAYEATLTSFLADNK